MPNLMYMTSFENMPARETFHTFFIPLISSPIKGPKLNKRPPQL